MNQELINRIFKVAETEPKSREQLIIKLMEEVGEVSQAHLSTVKASGSQYKELTDEDFQEELVDTILVTLTLLKKTGISNEELTNLLTKKINKWESKQGK
ncbi:MazG-like family protein [Vagococcus sp. DIV0080]|uniref:MazG-like family protein n=1 Tax=Candidatus Vagococcus giribetii TaxID=2230876 RepID=A0ABS3HTS3_9ENTE|nr:MazG-like family protein [Vagococcus sp. DIV0080]MBO0477105.1 MazG-like family protein [Vagococcus sp. DIV0080]